MDETFATHLLDVLNTQEWSNIKPRLIEYIVDSMPSDIIEKITNDPSDFEKAHQFLIDYYEPDDKNKRLLTDMFSIFGEKDVALLVDGYFADFIESNNN